MEVLGHSASRVRRQELKWCSVGGGGGDDSSVLKAVVLTQNLKQLRDGRPLLTHGHVDAVQVALIVVYSVHRLLVEDGVDGNGGLARLTITNDQLTLTAANWDQTVDSLEASRHRLVHGLPRDDARRLQ